MRRIHIRRGLAQRINDLLGTDNGEDPLGVDETIPGLTAWSIQAAMIENIRRIGRALVGDVAGRPLKGLWAELKSGDVSISISPGIGVTSAGDIVVVEKEISYTFGSGTTYIYLRHKTAELEEDDDNGGRNTEFIGKDNVNKEEIVYDDYAASLGDSISGNLVVEQSPTKHDPEDEPNLIYICTIAGGTPPVVTNSFARGLTSGEGIDGALDSDKFLMALGLKTLKKIVAGIGGIETDSLFEKTADAGISVGSDVEFNESKILKVGTNEGLNETLTLASIDSITISRGLITGKSPA